MLDSIFGAVVNYKHIKCGKVVRVKMTVRLKVFRKEIKLTQRQMANSIGVSLSMYEKVERESIKASRNFIDALKYKYPHIDINYIFFDV
ncbi:helix-turn-helix domain-containing protein [Bacillus cereus]|uniref:helix-turn-helix domain-containing protein n=2 Tax=Bacillus TaxID=1386 RepID=UPI0020B84751|nr:helix-turn-helix transcriptional regulator [Bacillus cereus]